MRVVRTYVEEIVGTCPLLRLHLQSKVQEISENGGKCLFILDPRCTVLRDQIERSQR